MSLFGLPLLDCVRYIVNGEFLKYLFVLLWLRKHKRNKRLHPYDPSNFKDLTNLGTVIPQGEQQFDPPAKEITPHTTDSVLFYGGNTLGDILLVRICREKTGHVLCLYMKLSDGRVYELTKVNKSFPPSEDFTAGGLKIKCLTPMRKWRIFFNGFLRETRNEEKYRIVHMKFSFICISTSFTFDLSTDINSATLAKYIVDRSQGRWSCIPERVVKHLDRHVQAVSILGTITVENGSEIELNLWGAKHRSKDISTCQKKNDSSLLEFIGYSKDGQLIYTGEYNDQSPKSRLTFGHLVERTSLSWPTIESCQKFVKDDAANFNGMNIAITTERTAVSGTVTVPSASKTCLSGISPGHSTRAHFCTFQLQDGDSGNAVVLRHTWNGPPSDIAKPAWKIPLASPVNLDATQPLLLELDSPTCRCTTLAGGKGASLATLIYLSQKYNMGFKVPAGFVLSTAAYQEFCTITGLNNAISEFDRHIRGTDLESAKDVCNTFVDKVSKTRLPALIEDLIRQQLQKTFGDEWSQKYFAVRSSSAEEDSEAMSAAGQMSTVLGAGGIENILKAVVTCWASQFSFTAVQYKRKYGQEINSQMSVVIQEMVPSQSAGVLFTCDPVNGNPRNISITANYGLGESVVSGTTDPDIIVVNRNHTNQVSLKNVQLGKKKVMLVMSDGGEITEKTTSDSDAKLCCILPVQALLLSEVCLKIEEAYGYPIDVEWAFLKDQLYILQARPITTFDQETWYELAHAVDHGMRAENEYNTKANIGEILPGAISHFGLSYLYQYLLYMFYDLYSHRNKYSFPFHPFQSSIPNVMNHSFISMPLFVLRFYTKGERSVIAESNIISGFGRLLDDEEMFDQAHKRNQCYPGTFVPYQIFLILSDLVLAEGRLNRAVKRLWQEEINLSSCENSKEMYLEIWKKAIQTVYGPSRHLENTLISSIYNSIIMSILAKANGGWNATVYSDIASILTSCGDVESLDVPLSIQLLVKEIKKCTDAEKFKLMETKEALDWLESGSNLASTGFKNFIVKHGHRCIKEYDVYSKPWRVDKIPLVKILQESMNLNDSYTRPASTAAEVIKNLKTPLSMKDRLLLRILIPLSRNAVKNREKGKSTMIKHFDMARKAFYILAEQLHKEGRLPDKELMFFLSNHEVMELIETRSPYLVRSAIQRRKIFSELDELKFPQITIGVPKPVKKEVVSFDHLPGELEMKGTPVSFGIVKGVARVATSIKEAPNIRPGEILIAYCTDIGWSPYFPLLGGIVTELGGLISHGAVVAREYGLPCVVGVTDATVQFKTGDAVILDGNKGTLRKIKGEGKNEVISNSVAKQTS